MKYLIVIEKTRTGYAAYSPDLDGCVAAGRTRPSVEKTMRGALELHLAAYRAEGRKVPPPSTTSAYVDVPA